MVKPARSNKSPAVKAAVLIRRGNGEPKRQIARDLAISRPTVDKIIKEANLDQQIESGTLQCAGLIPASIQVVKDRLSKGSESAAFKVLEGLGVIGPNAKVGKAVQPADTVVNLAIQNLIQTTPQQVIDNKTDNQ